MNDTLQRALIYLDAVGVDVLAHGLSADGSEYVVVLDKGIAGGPKYRIPVAALPELPKPIEAKAVAIDEPSPWEKKAEPAGPDYAAMSYRELQQAAIDAGIPGNQSKADLLAALEAVDD